MGEALDLGLAAITEDHRKVSPNDGAPAALLLCWPGGTIEFADRQLLEWFGWSSADVLGHPISDVVPEAESLTEDGVWCRTAIRDGEGLKVDGLVHRIPLDSGTGNGLVAWRLSRTGNPQPGLTDLLAAIMRSTDEAIITKSGAGVITSWNPGAVRLYGYTAAEMIGHTAEALFPPDERAEEDELLKRVGGGQTVEHHRIVRVRADGERVLVELTAMPLKDSIGRIMGVLTVSKDISGRLREEQQFQDLIEAAPDGMIGVNYAGDIVQVNKRTEQMFDYRRDQLVGQRVEILVPDYAVEVHRKLRQQYGEKPTYRMMGAGQSLWAQRRDGSTFPVEIVLAPLTAHDDMVAVAAVRDKTVALATEGRLIQLETEAAEERMQTKLLRAQRLDSLGQLAGGIAHDFNNLLGVVINYSHFVLDAIASVNPDSDQIAKDAGQILRASQRGSSLTRQLLAFAQRDIMRPAVVSLNDIIGDIQEMLERTLGDQVDVRTELHPAIPDVLADPGQIEQIMINLAVNARDALPLGGHITIITEPVTITEDFKTNGPSIGAGQYVATRVNDDGIGMPPDVVQRIFDPFFTTKPPGKGTGLGLAMVFGIVAQSGGTVTVHSTPGEGTTISMLLPAITEPVRTAHVTPEQGIDTGGERLLIVEDEESLRRACKRILAGAGYDVTAPKSSREAHRLAESSCAPFDLIVTDVVMPDILGQELADHLIASKKAAGVLFMSGYARPLLSSEGKLHATAKLLEKPFTPAELLSAVRDALHRTRTFAPVTKLPRENHR